LHFANTHCVNCGLKVGFLPDEQQLSALTTKANGQLLASNNGKQYRHCKNFTIYDICNWMIGEDDDNELCVSCRLTETIPNLDDPEKIRPWFLLEHAKRRFLYSAIKLRLPIQNKEEDPQRGLGFAFMENQVEDSFGNELFVKNYVTTGHSNGLITLNMEEASDSARMDIREKMNERYRTLLGHFRHESGHYYWDRLILNTDRQDEFRELFGDERLDYQAAMSHYYENGPVKNWQDVWISAYATMHPWEDWAETWAHYLHMVDTLETANDFELTVSQNAIKSPYESDQDNSNLAVETSFTKLCNGWFSLTQVLNALNRSMGMDDAYPFVISLTSLKKLRFVHQTIKANLS
jgi:hypothetical protein